MWRGLPWTAINFATAAIISWMSYKGYHDAKFSLILFFLAYIALSVANSKQR